MLGFFISCNNLKIINRLSFAKRVNRQANLIIHTASQEYLISKLTRFSNLTESLIMSRRNRHTTAPNRRFATSNQQKEGSIAQYKYDDVSLAHLASLDIYPQILDDLRAPGKAISYLMQIITVANNQVKKCGNPQFVTESRDSFWVGFFTIDFPERKTFICRSKTKKDCKNLCSLAALYHLRKINAVDAHLNVNIDASVTSDFLERTRGPVQVPQIPMLIKQQMMSFTRKFDECIADLIDYRIQSVKNDYEGSGVTGIESNNTAILEGYDLDEGIASGQNSEYSDNLPPSGIIDIVSGKTYSPPSIQDRTKAFAILKGLINSKRPAYRQSHLPIFSMREKIISAIKDFRVIVVAGDTGSGKSTQVPKYILEDFLSSDGNATGYVNVAVTQPRRISAISLAERVSMELGESSAGNTVGYHVRFDSLKPSRDLNIIQFFTIGMLLRKMQFNPDLKGISHLVIDEAHERDCPTDFLLILIKQLLSRRRDLKVILMSASLDAGLFSRYFDNCPVITVSGRLFPITEYHIDDICQDLQIRVPLDDPDRVPKLKYDIITKLVRHIDYTRDPGAILCFVPGWNDIKTLQKELARFENQFQVLPMHSKLPIEAQRQVFRRVDGTERKVVLATNIAETSVTIDDVKYVIDTGVMNSIDYDRELNMSSFGSRWVSKANVKQRAGRAGRTSSGECFKLYSKEQELRFQDFPTPELLRIPLETVIMESKYHCPGEKAAEFLSKAIQHPSLSAIHSAIDELTVLNILDRDENLTVLGKRISGFSSHPRVSISLIAASALRCLYPVLNSSAILCTSQEPFQAIVEKQLIRDAKKDLCTGATSLDRDPLNFMSDDIAFGNLLAQLDNATTPQEWEYLVRDYHLNRSAIHNFMSGREINARSMVRANFVSNHDLYSTNSAVNRDMNELEMMIGVLTLSFYPKIIRLIRGRVSHGRIYPNKIYAIDVPSNNKVRFGSESIVRNIAAGRGLDSKTREEGGPESDDDSDYASMSDVTDASRPTFITYLHSRLDQDGSFIVARHGSIVPPLTALIFGGREFAIHELSGSSRSEAKFDTDLVNVVLDRYSLLSFRIARDDAQAIREWRRVWNLYFNWHIHTKNTSLPVDPNDSIIGETMNEFLELNKKLYASVR